jgi:predicted acylesterase/phospholipase RssA
LSYGSEDCWLKKITTIEDLLRDKSNPIKKFRILVSNITNSAYREITEQHTSENVADAVGQSISIPIVFKPYRTAATCYVDGGMLSNYPLWLFQDSDDPTLGGRLRSKSDESLSSYK